MRVLGKHCTIYIYLCIILYYMGYGHGIYIYIFSIVPIIIIKAVKEPKIKRVWGLIILRLERYLY